MLVVAIAVVFGDLRRFELVDFDDLAYVSANPRIAAGLTMDGVVWAFTHANEGYWSPLTWLSYMADVQLFGVNSGALHLTNVVIHAASTCLLFAAFTRMTRERWASACVAALFAVHPLHVESVAWVAERKDVLCAFFSMLTIWAYVRYVELARPLRYTVVLAAFACALMSKPMAVTLPVVLLLLDLWPLGRKGPRYGEKVPLVAMALVVSAITVVTQRGAGAMVSAGVAPPLTRVENALVSYVWYLVKMIWPSSLAAIYPFPLFVPLWQALAAAAVLVAITGAVVTARRSVSYLFVGWLWYVVTLFPVIGILQAGPQARADRYTYLSMIGMSIMFVWGARDLLHDASLARKRAVAFTGCAALVMFAALAWKQVQYWKNTETLFRRAIDVTPANYVAHQGLGTALRRSGRLDQSIAHFREAIALHPQYAEAHNNLGEALLSQGRADEALPHLTEAVRLNPGDSAAHLNRASALNAAGRPAEAEPEYREATRLSPLMASAHSGLGSVLTAMGKDDEALRELAEAIRLDPRDASARYNRGSIFAKQRRMDDAIANFAAAVQLKPDDVKARNNLGGALAQTGRLDEAIAQFSEAARLRPDLPDVRRNLDLALELRQRAQAGRR